MPCFSADRKAQIESRIASYQAQIDAAENNIDSIMTEIESYKFDSGEGSQQTRFRKIEEYQKSIQWLYAQIDYWQAKLSGTGITNLNLRRNRGNYGYRR